MGWAALRFGLGGTSLGGIPLSAIVENSYLISHISYLISTPKAVLLATLLFLAGWQEGWGQNLIPNPDFEIHNGCPLNYSGDLPFYAPPWKNATYGTIDYSGCGIINLGSPVSNAQSGIGWISGFAGASPPPNRKYSEYAQIKLLAPLVAGEKYILTGYLSFDKSHSSGVSMYGALFNQIGGSFGLPAYGSTVPQSVDPIPTAGADRVFAAFTTTSAITLNTWLPVSTIFTAMGGEEYITLGPFFIADITIMYGLDNLSLTKLSTDLSLTVSPTTQTANKGETITYTYTLTNATMSVDNVTSKIKVPAGLTLLQATPQQGTYNNNTKIWDVGTMPVGSKTLIMKLKVD